MIRAETIAGILRRMRNGTTTSDDAIAIASYMSGMAYRLAELVDGGEQIAYQHLQEVLRREIMRGEWKYDD